MDGNLLLKQQAAVALGPLFAEDAAEALFGAVGMESLEHHRLTFDGAAWWRILQLGEVAGGALQQRGEAFLDVVRAQLGVQSTA